MPGHGSKPSPLMKSTRCSGQPSVSASAGALAPAKTALTSMKAFHLSGSALSSKMAVVGHSGSQAPQSMHSSGWMTSEFTPSERHSPGQSATQSVYSHLVHGPATMYGRISGLVEALFR